MRDYFITKDGRIFKVLHTDDRLVTDARFLPHQLGNTYSLNDLSESFVRRELTEAEVMAGILSGTINR